MTDRTFKMLAWRYDKKEDLLARILSTMFDEDEARMYLHLPSTPADVARRCAVERARAEEALKHGWRTGLLFRDPSKNLYSLIHSRNLEESILGDIRNNALGEEFIDLWRQRARLERESTKKEDIKPGDTGRRILPVTEGGHVHDQVIPFDDATKVAHNAGLRAAGQCSCRMTVNRCDAPVDDICLAFDNTAELFIERGAMRELSPQQTRDILTRGADAGLVHMSSGLHHDGALTGVEFICNCCTCCCNLLWPYLASNRTIPIGRNYEARVDASLCDGCGECEERCQFEAIRNADELAEIDTDNCVGCGQCAYICPAECIELHLRHEAPDEPPHTHDNWVGPMEPLEPEPT